MDIALLVCFHSKPKRHSEVPARDAVIREEYIADLSVQAYGCCAILSPVASLQLATGWSGSSLSICARLSARRVPGVPLACGFGMEVVHIRTRIQGYDEQLQWDKGRCSRAWPDSRIESAVVKGSGVAGEGYEDSNARCRSFCRFADALDVSLQFCQEPRLCGYACSVNAVCSCGVSVSL